MSDISDITTFVRQLAEDFSRTQAPGDIFTYTTSAIFTLSEENVIAITDVFRNGTALTTSDWTFDSGTNKITITDSLIADDEILIQYTYYKYSDTELNGYIRNALVFISVFGSCEEDYELETDAIEPTPDNKTTDLIALIASILINPDWSSYKLPNVTVNYPKTMTKEAKIEELISKFYRSNGVWDMIQWDY